jgi:hypothetical protein
MDSYLSGYVDGLVNMASSVSKKIGLSYIRGYCFKKDIFKSEFSKEFKIKKFNLESSNKEYLNIYLEDNLIDILNYWIKIRFGDVINYYTIDNLDIKNTLFYIVDDIIVLEYNDYMLCLIIGNNE